MPNAPAPPDEATRLDALAKLGILDSPPDAEFDAIVRVASLVCDMPISLISLVDDQRQWFKANIGLPGVAETPRAQAFCAHTILEPGLLEVPDATLDSRFAANPLVTGAPDIRFYAGAPLRLTDGSQIGSLCVIDRQPRTLDPAQREILRSLAHAASCAIESWATRRQQRQTLAAGQQRLSNLIEGAGIGTFEWNIQTREISFNSRAAAVIGVDAGCPLPLSIKTLREHAHPDDVASHRGRLEQHLDGHTKHHQFEGRVLHADGHWVWVQVSGTVMTRTADGAPELMYGSLTDIDARKRQDAALRKSEEFLEQTGRVAGVGGWELDLDTCAMHWTAETFRIHGLALGCQPSLERAIEFYPPQARPTIRDALAKAAEHGEAWDLELPFIRADGRKIWVRSVGSAVFTNGRPARLTGALQDVTSHVCERGALRRANERLELAADSGGIGIWEWNIDHDEMVWDARMRRIYGLADADDHGAHGLWSSLLHPADREAAQQAIRDAIALRVPYDAEFRVVQPAGAIRWVKALGRVYDGDPGTPLRMLGVNFDITRERQLSADLAEQHALLRVTLRSIADGVITTDAGGRILWLNPVAEHLTGWPAQEAAGQPLPAIFVFIDEETRDPLPDPVTACLSRASVPDPARPALLAARGGGEHAIENSAAPILDESGGVLGAVLVFRDVTRQRLEAAREARERELRAANAELDRLASHFAEARTIAEQASRAKTRFLASMSHELRTPLHGILGYAQLLRMDGGLTQTQGARIEAMLAAGTHLLEMISCVLDLSEIETAGIELQTAVIDLPGIIDASLNIVRPTAEAKRLTLARTIGPDVPRRVMLDPARLRQVLLNLLGNAVKFTAFGGVELRLVTAGEGQRLRFEVWDTGPGIPPGHRHRLFEAFERLGAGTAEPAEGSGLGLSLSRGLATLMGGAVGHTDRPGGGSVFWLELPLVAEMAASPPARATQFGVDSAPRLPPPPTGLPRVLVVDDVDMNRDIAAAFIRSASYDVVCAEGGAEAVAAAAATDFHVIMMDVRMPGVDGLEATRRIRTLDPPRGQVPIVALTAQVFTEQVEACRQAGMDTHVAKPFTLDTLLEGIKRGIAAAQSRPASTI